jgi:hypothetical protein
MSQGLSSYFSGLSVLPSPAPERVAEFPASDEPVEIRALGEPQCVFKPGSLANLASFRYPLAALVALGAAGVAVALHQDLVRKNQLDGNALFVFGVLGALASFVVAVLIALPITTATVFCYSQAAVVADRNKLTLIPWTQLLYSQSRIATPEGRQFYCGWLENFSAFEEQIWDYSAEHWLPAAVARVKAGETVTAGDLAVNAREISYQRKTLAWDQVTRLVLVTGKRYQLNIGANGSWFDWAAIDLHQIPNARSVEQLITSICPSRLLKPAG